MINPNLLSDSLAAQVASEVLCSKLRTAANDYLTNEIVSNTAKEIERIVAELKERAYPHQEFFDVLFKALNPYEKKFTKMINEIWEEERKIIVANIKKMKKAYLTKDAIDQLLYPRSASEKKLSAQATEVILVILGERGAIEMGTIAAADVVFDVQNPEVQSWLAGYTPKFSVNLEEVSVAKLRTELIEGIKAGEGIPELIKRVNLTYDNWNKVRSETIARSEAMRANNRAAIEAYKQSGVVKKKIWMTSPGACGWCKPLNGKVVALKKPFFNQGDSYSVNIDGARRVMKLDYENVESPPLHPRCLLPETECISPGGFITGLRAKYIGKAIEFKFSDGSKLSVTPNHLLLTPHGFAAANLLCRGDDVVYCPEFKRIIFSDPDNNRQPASVEDIVSSLSELSGMFFSSMPVSSEYLHGDGRFCDGNIDIIGTDRFLRNTIKPSFPQSIDTYDFNSTYPNATAFSRLSSLTEQFKRLAFATDGIMGGSRQSSSFFSARSGHSSIHRGTTISGDNIIFEQSSSNHRSANLESFRQSLFRLSRVVETKKIIDIKIFSFHGNVYDFQTPTSLYIANGILLSNCRCSIGPWIEE